MPSEGKPSWLGGIAQILRATTHDLKTLAHLAGLDPKTMYIGTRIDGADLKGQDLRGITFTHLDRLKVELDERTLLDEPTPRENPDPDQVAESTSQEPNSLLPPYREIEEALLAHLLASGPIEAKSVYRPLADRLGLSEIQRTITRPDNSTPLWNNRVQWARRALKDQGYLEAETRGVWRLTLAGTQAAKKIGRVVR